MISYPSAKINIGLHIVEKRPDGYHDIESIFYPIPLFDILEINKSQKFIFTCSGIAIDGDRDSNLVVKAYKILQKLYALDPVHIHLHKQIPMGAGLGGGSADAAYALKMLNQLFHLNIGTHQLEKYALEIGSDCPFFIDNTPKYVTGIGEKMEHIQIDLAGQYLYIINPGIHISTVEAYGQIIPKKSDIDLITEASHPIASWQKSLENAFEKPVFTLHPTIEKIKEQLRKAGALYTSMSGTGSTVYGIFNFPPKKLENYAYEKVLKL
jgi:4-diphosphocytidyl-2-C-methyl-D-erythritol kinase